MPDLLVHGMKQQLDLLFSDAAALQSHLRNSSFARDGVIQAEMSRYLCVRVSGFLDAAVSHILAMHIDGLSAPTVARFASLCLGRLQNLNAEKLTRLLNNFDPAWADSFSAFLDPKKKDDIDSLVANRNNIAHGRPTTVTYSRVSVFYATAREVVDYIDGSVPR
jgi:hypothetical protein